MRMGTGVGSDRTKCARVGPVWVGKYIGDYCKILTGFFACYLLPFNVYNIFPITPPRIPTLPNIKLFEILFVSLLYGVGIK